MNSRRFILGILFLVIELFCFQEVMKEVVRVKGREVMLGMWESIGIKEFKRFQYNWNSSLYNVFRV